MHRLILSLVLVSLTLLALFGTTAEAETLEQHFGDYEGCFLVAELDGTPLLRWGACSERYPPCSTFKIPNSLIGLETGAIDLDTVLPWDGKKKYLRSWEQDHDLASAIRYSVVWYYQELARRVGEEKMQDYVDRFNYGNRDISGGLTTFWLSSSIKISPDEQIRFLSKLYTGELPVSETSVETVKKILFFKGSDKSGASAGQPPWSLSAKTGSCRLEGQDTLGWWVGNWTQGDQQRLFATRILGKGADGPTARKLTLRMLADPEVASKIGAQALDLEP